MKHQIDPLVDCVFKALLVDWNQDFPKLPQFHHELRLCDPKTSAYIERESAIHVFEFGKIKKNLEVHTELELHFRVFDRLSDGPGGGCHNLKPRAIIA